MAAEPYTIRVGEQAFELLEREARRRGVGPDELADELLRTDLSGAPVERTAALAALADLRATLPALDAVAFARAARDELDAR